jgi:hypothetical protein
MGPELGCKVCSDNAADPAVILDPVEVAYRILLFIGAWEVAVCIGDYIAGDEDICNGFLPVEPIVVGEAVSVREANDAGEVAKAYKRDCGVYIRGFVGGFIGGFFHVFIVVGHCCLRINVGDVAEDV